MATKLDYDSLLKEFVSDFFPEFVAFAHPQLHQDIDWGKGYTFLEQELINALKGRWKMKGKKKLTDKLVRVTLLNGEEQIIFIHIEFQHSPDAAFSRRMEEYRMFINLKFDFPPLTAFVIFTDAPPPAQALLYEQQCYGTHVSYQYNSLIPALMDEATLLEQANNPIAVAALCAKYNYESRNNPEMRRSFKQYLADLAFMEKADIEKVIKILIFVKDFMKLPPRLEEAFMETNYSKLFPKEEKMTVSKSTKEFAATVYKRAFGVDPMEVQQQLKQEQKRAEQEIVNIIRNLSQTLGLSVDEISKVVSKDVDYIQIVLRAE